MAKQFILTTILDAIRSALPQKGDMIALHEPWFRGNENSYIKECIDTGWVSSVGKYVDQFEERLADYTGAKRAIAVVNGTAALHLCLRLMSVEPGDEILIPTLTFVATANAVAYCGAIPHFIDSEVRTLGVDPIKLDRYLNDIADISQDGCVNRVTGRCIKGLIAMHTYGHPVDLDPLAATCRRFKLEMIEDAAESMGSYYKERHTGNWGSVSAVSFNGNKIITTGGGGAILTNDEEYGRLAKHISTTARLPHRWEFVHDMIGYNYRMPNINAALGCAQLESLPYYLKAKRVLASRYREALKRIEGIYFVEEPPNSRSNYWLNSLLLDESIADERDRLLEMADDCGIMMRPTWTLMHKLPMYRECPKMDLRVSEDLSKRLVNIPSGAILGADA